MARTIQTAPGVGGGAHGGNVLLRSGSAFLKLPFLIHRPNTNRTTTFFLVLQTFPDSAPLSWKV